MEKNNRQKQEITIEKLISLGEYVIQTMENPDNEIDIRPEMLDALKKEVTYTKRFMGKISQDNPELRNIISYFGRQKQIVDEVVLRPHMKQDVEFTVKFITSNQKRVNDILSDISK